MKKHLFFLFLFLFTGVYMVTTAQKRDSLQRGLTPVEVFSSRISADTSKWIAEEDTSKVDTIYLDNPMNVVKINGDFASAYGLLGISYERVIGFRGSIQLKAEYIGLYNPFGGLSYLEEAYNNTSSISGIGFTPEIRYHGSERYAPLGIFAGFYVPLKFASVHVPAIIERGGGIYSIPKQDLSYSLIAIGFDAGYQHVFKNKISIEGLLGFAIGKGQFSEKYYSATYTLNDGTVLENKVLVRDGTIGNAIYPRLEFSVGYAF